MIRVPPCRRRAAVAVESALVYPVLFILLFGLIIGGLGVTRYQVVAYMAREAARFASVRGADWQVSMNQSSPTADQIGQNIVLPLAVAMDAAQLQTVVQWVNGATGDVSDWDSSTKATVTLTASGDVIANRVRVTITYTWFPELFLGGPVVLQSVCETPMCF